MSTTEVHNPIASRAVKHVALRLEAAVIPVSDVDRAKQFYTQLGWRLDADVSFDNGFRVVQFTPPGSPASVQFGTKLTSAAPGSAQNTYLVVSDIEAARNELVALGTDVSEVARHETRGSTGDELALIREEQAASVYARMMKRAGTPGGLVAASRSHCLNSLGHSGRISDDAIYATVVILARQPVTRDRLGPSRARRPALSATLSRSMVRDARIRRSI